MSETLESNFKGAYMPGILLHVPTPFTLTLVNCLRSCFLFHSGNKGNQENFQKLPPPSMPVFLPFLPVCQRNSPALVPKGIPCPGALEVIADCVQEDFTPKSFPPVSYMINFSVSLETFPSAQVVISVTLYKWEKQQQQQQQTHENQKTVE